AFPDRNCVTGSLASQEAWRRSMASLAPTARSACWVPRRAEWRWCREAGSLWGRLKWEPERRSQRLLVLAAALSQSL
ncbi:hypothetical protein, partial [Mycobacterium xenopi]|uniref:hypothetical protein n=1 Tax=Mycobacterium xenopi TaxID=1789 RepID=UPI001B80AAE9